jgi:hypothetical protein
MPENDLDELFGPRSRDEKEEQKKEEGEEAIETTIETSARDSGRGPSLTDSLRSMLPSGKPCDVSDRIRALSTKPIDYETISDTSIVIEILQAEPPLKISKRAEDKFQMWLRKRGEGLPQHSQENMRRALIIREHINTVLRYVNGAFVYSGTDAVKGFQFGLSLYKRVKERPVLEWPKVAEEMIGLWKFKPGFEEGYLRACAHMVLKTLYYLTKG